MRPVVLSIAGSDSSAGAGIQADLKAIEANGGFAVTVVTAVTAQNTVELRRTDALPVASVREQLRAVFDDFDVRAVKTGMLVGAGTVEAVAGILADRRPPFLVCDPVMASSTGSELLDGAGIEAWRTRLMPLASIVTPNVPEAARLAAMEIHTLEDAERAARRIAAAGAAAVLVKGGHLTEDQGTDVLVHRDGMRVFAGTPLASRSTHGTGCVLASAIATWLARGAGLECAVERARRFTVRSMTHGVAHGRGHGAVDPLHRLHRPTSDGPPRDPDWSQ
jgi:hydroxymethylpyrimidine/phosphomethylpyrimidine kinase